MFENTPYEVVAKKWQENAEKFNSAAVHEVFKVVTDNLKAWGEMAQNQAQASQAAAAESLEAFKNVKDPQAAFEIMKAAADRSIAMAVQNHKDMTALGVAQFIDILDAVEQYHPAPEAFASVSKALKEAASSMEGAVKSALQPGLTDVKVVTDVQAKATPKKARST